MNTIQNLFGLRKKHKIVISNRSNDRSKCEQSPASLCLRSLTSSLCLRKVRDDEKSILRILQKILITFGVLSLLALPLTHAQQSVEIPFGADEVGMHDFNTGGRTDIQDTHGGVNKGHIIGGEALNQVVIGVKNVVAAFAIAFMVYYGLQMVTAGGSEENVNQARSGLIWSILALVTMLVIDTAIFDIFYGGRVGGLGQATTFDSEQTLRATVDNASNLVIQALEWFQGILIIIAVGYLCLSGIKMLVAFGNQEDIDAQKIVFTWAGVGVVVLLLNNVLIQEVVYKYVLADNFEVVYAPDAGRGIREIIGVIRYFLQFLAVVAFTVFVYGGGQWIFSFGNDDRVETGKKVVLSAGIGIVIILVSYVVVSSMVRGQI